MKYSFLSIALIFSGLSISAQNYINTIDVNTDNNVYNNTNVSTINYNPQNIGPQVNVPSGNQTAMINNGNRGNVFNTNDNVNKQRGNVQTNQRVQIQVNETSNPQVGNRQNTNKPINKTNVKKQKESNFKPIGLSGRSYNGSKRKKKSKFSKWAYKMKKKSRKKKSFKKKRKHKTSLCAKW